MLATDLMLGTMSLMGMAGGILALVYYQKGKNGHVAEPPRQPEDPQLAKLADAIQPLVALPNRLEAAWEKALEQRTPVFELPPTPPPPPEPTWPADLARTIEGLGHRLESLEVALQTAPPPPPPPADPSLLEIAERLEVITEMLSEHRAPPELAQLVRSMADIPVRISERMGEIVNRAIRITAAVPPSSGGGAPPPPRRDPPASIPRAAPGAAPAVPQIPAAYVGGSVFAPAGEVSSLLLLIQTQLSPNCPGTSAEFGVSAEGDVYVGAASALGGPLSITNYAYLLAAGGPPRIYRSTYPGNNTPIGELQVLAPDGAYLNVEVQS